MFPMRGSSPFCLVPMESVAGAQLPIPMRQTPRSPCVSFLRWLKILWIVLKANLQEAFLVVFDGGMCGDLSIFFICFCCTYLWFNPVKIGLAHNLRIWDCVVFWGWSGSLPSCLQEALEKLQKDEAQNALIPQETSRPSGRWFECVRYSKRIWCQPLPPGNLT